MNDVDRLSEHRSKLQAAGAAPMTVAEILAGETQAGVPRPMFSVYPDEGTHLDSRDFRIGGDSGVRS